MAFEYLAQYSAFDSVEEMDNRVEQHIQQHYYDLTASERAIVFTLASRSLAYPGASHLKADTIAEQVGVSRRTVMTGIKKLIELEIIEKVNCTKMNGIKGANIYKILSFTSKASQRVNVEQVSIDVEYDDFSENQSLQSFNLLKTSTTNNLYIADQDCDQVSDQDETAYMNEYQQMLYTFMSDLPLVQAVKDELYKLVLASEIDSVEAFHTAKDVIVNITKDIADGTLVVNKSIRSVFVGAYKARTERLNSKPSTTISVEEKHDWERPVPFYNWLDERPSDWTPSENNYMPIDNWLEWR